VHRCTVGCTITFYLELKKLNDWKCRSMDPSFRIYTFCSDAPVISYFSFHKPIFRSIMIHLYKMVRLVGRDADQVKSVFRGNQLIEMWLLVI
jgi:hypothetical protein